MGKLIRINGIMFAFVKIVISVSIEECIKILVVFMRINWVVKTLLNLKTRNVYAWLIIVDFLSMDARTVRGSRVKLCRLIQATDESDKKSCGFPVRLSAVAPIKCSQSALDGTLSSKASTCEPNSRGLL